MVHAADDMTLSDRPRNSLAPGQGEGVLFGSLKLCLKMDITYNIALILKIKSQDHNLIVTICPMRESPPPLHSEVPSVGVPSCLSIILPLLKGEEAMREIASGYAARD